MGYGKKSNNVYFYTGGAAGLKEAIEKKTFIDLGELGGQQLWISLSPEYAYNHKIKERGRKLWQFKIPAGVFTKGLSEKHIVRSEANPSINFTIDESFMANNTPPIIINEILNFLPGDVLDEP